jgi:hypothetical protein
VCVNDIQVCERVIRIQVTGMWRVSWVQGIYVFESVSWKVGWKVRYFQGIYVFESVSWKQTLHLLVADLTHYVVYFLHLRHIAEFTFNIIEI